MERRKDLNTLQLATPACFHMHSHTNNTQHPNCVLRNFHAARAQERPRNTSAFEAVMEAMMKVTKLNCSKDMRRETMKEFSNITQIRLKASSGRMSVSSLHLKMTTQV